MSQVSKYDNTGSNYEVYFRSPETGAGNHINEVIKFHHSHGKMITGTGVRPPARFGELTINEKNEVLEFKEKPNINEGWINGGFFVIEPKFLDYINGDNCILEKEPLEKAAKSKELVAYLHDGFWHCIETKRDKDNLEEIIKNNKVW